MKRDFEKRLEVLESAIKNELKSGLWIDMSNNRVRIDHGGRRGKEMTFDTAYEAARYVESRIDLHDSAHGSICVSDVCDLFEESDTLRSVIGEIIPYDTFKGKTGVFFGCLKTNEPADINLWMVGAALKSFDTVGFFQRLKNNEVSDFDNQFFMACFGLFSCCREGDYQKLADDFSRLFLSVTGLRGAISVESKEK